MTRLWIIEDDADFADVLRESLELDASFEAERLLKSCPHHQLVEKRNFLAAGTAASMLVPIWERIQNACLASLSGR